MREIINIQLGQCGNQVGSKFWDLICQEHSIQNDGTKLPNAEKCEERKLENLEVYFREAEATRFVPRAVLADLEPGPLDMIRGGPSGSLYRPDNFVYGSGGAGNNWVTGFLTKGASKIDEIFDVVRKEAESCDCLQGFKVFHSLGGGTGSGLGSLVLSLLREEFPDRMFASVSVLPSPKVSDIVVEPYNTMLAIDQLIEWCDEVFCMDNQALYDICTNSMGKKRICYADLNSLIAQTMSGVTTTLRFPGQLNSDLRKLAVNMIPYPRLHFFITGMAPLRSAESQTFYSESVEQVTRELLEPRNIMCACDPRSGRFLTFAAMFRGQQLAMGEVEKHVSKLHDRNSAYFVEWIPNNAKVTVCDVPPCGRADGQARTTATLLANSTALQDVLVRIKQQFNKMFKRKAFVHWYVNEGLDPLSFNDANSNVSDLIAEYQQHTEVYTHEEKHFDRTFDDSLEDLDSGYGL
eukprot:gene19154-21074_t